MRKIAILLSLALGAVLVYAVWPGGEGPSEEAPTTIAQRNGENAPAPGDATRASVRSAPAPTVAEDDASPSNPDGMHASKANRASDMSRTFAELSADERRGAAGLKLVWEIGELGHRTSIPPLTAYLATPLPPKTKAEHESATEREREVILRSMALESLRKIGDRYRTRDVAGPISDAYFALVAGDDIHLATTAVMHLRSRAVDQEKMRETLRNLLGPEREYLLDVKLVRNIPEQQ